MIKAKKLMLRARDVAAGGKSGAHKTRNLMKVLNSGTDPIDMAPSTAYMDIELS